MTDHDAPEASADVADAADAADVVDDPTGDAAAEYQVAEPLQSALDALRTDADQLETMPLGGDRVAAAEHIADAAARFDEQIAHAARSDDD